MKLGFVGLGKLGACCAAVLAQSHDVIGIDTNAETIAAINARKPPSANKEPQLEELLKPGHLEATTDYAKLNGCEIIFIIVPTPSTEDNTFTHKYVDRVLGSIYIEMKTWPNRLHPLPIVIVSTLTPGSMWHLQRDCMSWLGDRAGEVELVYSPVFVALGQVVHDFCYPDALLVGTNNGLSSPNIDMLVRIYRNSVFIPSVEVHLMTWVEAEMAKLFLNVMLSVKSLYANELALLSGSVCADASRILSFVGADKRIGPKMMSPGFPPGGTCLPRDIRCISTLARRYFTRDNLFGTIEHIAETQMDEIISEIVFDLDDPVGVCGLGYKPGTPVREEASATAVIARLKEMGLTVYVHDFMIPAETPEQIASLGELAERVDSLVLCTMDKGYARTFTPEMLSGKIVYDIWGLLSPEQIIACRHYERFGNWR